MIVVAQVIVEILNLLMILFFFVSTDSHTCFLSFGCAAEIEQLEEIDHGANAHVETLARLDLVKTNMGDCLHTLTEAASWNALVREVNGR